MDSENQSESPARTKARNERITVSWKRYLFPSIHPEGRKIVAAVFLIFAIAGGLCSLGGAEVLSAVILGIGILATVFSFFFFRNPERVPPNDPDAVIAPADGLVCAIRTMRPPATLELGDEKRIRVSIFMSVFSVHVNRCPVGGTVRALKYHLGKFVSAADKESDENERQEICLERPDGVRIGVVQIAGLVARRIYCPLKLEEKVEPGAVFGLIRFGSRLDVYLPVGVEPTVLPGQTTVAGETIVARIPTQQNGA